MTTRRPSLDRSRCSDLLGPELLDGGELHRLRARRREAHFERPFSKPTRTKSRNARIRSGHRLISTTAVVETAAE